jgi:hypothetical protein
VLSTPAWIRVAGQIKNGQTVVLNGRSRNWSNNPVARSCSYQPFAVLVHTCIDPKKWSNLTGQKVVKGLMEKVVK